MNNLKRRIEAYKKLNAELRLQEERQRQYNSLVGEHLNYPIIKDLINSAVHGVVIRFILKDGTQMEIRREEKEELDDKANQLF